MREILFRGKRTNNDEWVEGFYQEYPEGYVHIQNTSNDWFPVIPETVGQYVGLKDRDGKKIFEGDILESPVKRIGQKYGNLIVIKDIRECKFAALYVADYSVIGNIYDNPELLEVK